MPGWKKNIPICLQAEPERGGVECKTAAEAHTSKRKYSKPSSCKFGHGQRMS